MRLIQHAGRGNRLRNLCISAVAGAIVSSAMPATAPAGYTQLTQTRSLNTSASAEVFNMPVSNDADTESSDALGSFDRSISSGASAAGFIPNPPFSASGGGQATARQSVQFAPTSIAGSLVGDASAGTRVATASGSAASTWSTTFNIDKSTPFNLDGSLGVSQLGTDISFASLTNSASLRLSRRADGGGPEQVLYNVFHDSPPLVPGGASGRSIDFSGVLEPGYVYTLAGTAAAGRSNNSVFVSAQTGGGITSQVTFTLTTVPEPAAAGVLPLSAGLLLRRRPA